MWAGSRTGLCTNFDTVQKWGLSPSKWTVVGGLKACLKPFTVRFHFNFLSEISVHRYIHNLYTNIVIIMIIYIIYAQIHYKTLMQVLHKQFSEILTIHYQINIPRIPRASVDLHHLTRSNINLTFKFMVEFHLVITAPLHANTLAISQNSKSCYP